MRWDGEVSAVVTLCKLSDKAYAKVNPEVWALPGKYGKLDIEPLQVTEGTRTREGRKGLQTVVESLLMAGLLEPCMFPHNTPILPVIKSDGTYRVGAEPKNNK